MREHLLSVSYKPNYTTMNNFQDELIKRLEQDYQSAKARYQCWIEKEDTPYKKEAIAFNKATMLQAKTTLFDIRELNAELSL